MISIIIPTYNHAPELRQCLASIQRQSFQDFEIIVVDDGSHDDPESVVRSYSNLKFFRQTNQGANVARNNGFTKASGEYVIFVDADVVLREDMLKKMHAILESQPEISFVYSAFKIGKKTMKYIPFNASLLAEFNYIHTTSLIRSSDFPGWDESIKKFQDWDVWLTMVLQHKKGIGINEVLFQIINPGAGTMSTWLPKFMYKIKWPVLGYTPLAIIRYNEAKLFIQKKHGLTDRVT